jgi:NAD-dependent dihydropyrimidine dehydrogenase PreA subunit/flavodoxin
MNLVVCFSPTGGTKKISEYAADYLKSPLIDLTSFKNQNNFDYSKYYEYIVICFPVYSQNIPNPVIDILKKLKSKYFLLLITYGRMNMGNVMYEALKLLNGTAIGGAYIPTKHTYKVGNYFSDYNKLNCLFERINNKITEKIKFPKLHKNPLSNIFPNLRSRNGLKLTKTDNCIICNLCNKYCPTNSINYGVVNNKCIRCLSCYFHCPNNGLNIKYSWFLQMYLRKDKIKDLIIY